MKRKYKISIITPAYNSVATLEETIQSVLRQTFCDYEYIIIDGGSTDGTIDILKKYSDCIKWISEADNGIYHAMKKGIKMSSGEWIYFIGSDDILYNCLHKIVPLFESRTIMYGNVFFKFRKVIWDGKFNSRKLIYRNIPHQGLFYPREVFELYSYEEKYKYLADYYLNLQCWKEKKFKFKYMPFVIAQYNDNGVSTNHYDKQFIKDRIKILLQYLPVYYAPYIIGRLTYSNIKLKLLGKL